MGVTILTGVEHMAAIEFGITYYQELEATDFDETEVNDEGAYDDGGIWMTPNYQLFRLDRVEEDMNGVPYYVGWVQIEDGSWQPATAPLGSLMTYIEQ
jgi:hypothetical protein